ncbi:SH3 domain-containing protein [Paraburkholderia sp. D15]|uniref:SH3 domain-containing protein n=1 Tax=Paraburkholderia sp. D15 TaxID=2880218 RepID=UPI0024790B6E|nr:SH3 domain-containing protein [Paraburkholderia sp. D15]WGS49127.1 SH3 domain-containing protein [Paraburkholderia sp. D15]
MHKTARFGFLISALFISQETMGSDQQSVTNFRNRAQLVFSMPVPPILIRKFGPGWMRLTFVRPDGSQLPLLEDEMLGNNGGVIFSMVGDRALSPSGNYLALDLTRNGMTQDEAGKSATASREFCPILDTENGCVSRDYSGAVCGGAWDSKNDVWRSQLDSGRPDMQSMSTLEMPTAKAVWSRYIHSGSADIKPFLRVALGLSNVKACDPPSAENATYYAQIENALGEEKTTNRTVDLPRNKAQSSSMLDLSDLRVRTVRRNHAWLYERPSVGSVRHGYLVKGDKVIVIGEQHTEWIKVRYEREDKSRVEAWMQTKGSRSINIRRLSFHNPHNMVENLTVR